MPMMRRPAGSPSGPKKQFARRRKVCKFCVEKIDFIDYKDVKLLNQFVPERGKVIPRRISGVCAPHQRKLSATIKIARNIALLPYTSE
jgi:small subunit ribosomal protein S18